MTKILLMGNDTSLITIKGSSSDTISEYNLGYVEPLDVSKYVLPLKKPKNGYMNDPLRPFHHKITSNKRRHI